MPKPKNPMVAEAKALFLEGMKLVDIAEKLRLPEGTVRRWKSTYGWGSERSDKKSERSERKKARKTEKEVAEDICEVLGNEELSGKQQLFCIYYIKSFNATKAYQKAYGVGYQTAASIGYRLLENDGVKKEIERLKKNRLNRALLSEEDIFQRYMDIAFADITDYVEFGRAEQQVMGAFGPVYEKNEETGEKIPVTVTVNEVRFKESGDVDGTLIQEVSQGRNGAKIKLADRMKAIDWLANHMELATAEQRARIENLQASTAKIRGEDPDGDEEDSGFIEALKGAAAEAWEED